jgi:hypothetical protein
LYLLPMNRRTQFSRDQLVSRIKTNFFPIIQYFYTYWIHSL